MTRWWFDRERGVSVGVASLLVTLLPLLFVPAVQTFAADWFTWGPGEYVTGSAWFQVLVAVAVGGIAGLRRT
jgi:hypothetical protein